ncbi:hypothetical protein M9H77_29598 [Catharanthus roseus]|uniref:Uncharacterized protein n=1 Tax=Catharanthus roseus TaxID=4058 RepID=A0ACB9ZYR0_CATRO|nr:hypothetical protein M9H77_29598 [Catharanthus roseus]
MAYPSHRWIYREGTLLDEPSRTTSSLSSYSLREIVPEMEPIPVINLSDDKSIEGPEMAPVAPGIGLGTSIEEDPSEPTLDSEMIPEPERVAPADAEGTSTFTVGGSPLSVSPVCGYCLWHEQRAEAAKIQWIEHVMSWSPGQDVLVASVLRQSRCWIEYRFTISNHANEAMSESSQNRQSEPIREATPRPEQATHKAIENFMIKMTELLETSMATRRNERVPTTIADEELERFLKFRPPEFYREVEEEIKAELFVEQLNDIYDTLKYEDALRLTFVDFRLRGMANDWWLRASEDTQEPTMDLERFSRRIKKGIHTSLGS